MEFPLLFSLQGSLPGWFMTPKVDYKMGAIYIKWPSWRKISPAKNPFINNNKTWSMCVNLVKCLSYLVTVYIFFNFSCLVDRYTLAMSDTYLYDFILTLLWPDNGSDGVSNHQPRNCLLNHSFRRRSKKTSKLRVTGLCEGNSLGTGEFPTLMASNAENVSIWWRHHEVTLPVINWDEYLRGFDFCSSS